MVFPIKYFLSYTNQLNLNSLSIVLLRYHTKSIEVLQHDLVVLGMLSTITFDSPPHKIFSRGGGWSRKMVNTHYKTIKKY